MLREQEVQQFKLWTDRWAHHKVMKYIVLQNCIVAINHFLILTSTTTLNEHLTDCLLMKRTETHG